MRRAARYAKVACLGALLALASCGAGCGSTLPVKPIADARAMVDSTDPLVARIDAGLLAVGPVLIAACMGTAPLLPAAQCGSALAGYGDAAEALDAAQGILVTVDAALAVLEAVAGAQ
jgi:hypothetical protein